MCEAKPRKRKGRCGGEKGKKKPNPQC